MNKFLLIIALVFVILASYKIFCILSSNIETFENKSLSETIKQINQEIEKENYLSNTTDNVNIDDTIKISKKEEPKENNNTFKDVKKVEKISNTTKESNNTLYSKKIYIKPDMSKYILKSQVPSCPKKVDLSKYILKTKIPNQPNMDNYILKNQIPSCPKLPNMDNYVLKNSIKACSKPIDMSKYVLKSSVPPPIECPCLPNDIKIPKNCPKPETICPKEIDPNKYILRSKIPKCVKNKTYKKYNITNINKTVKKMYKKQSSDASETKNMDKSGKKSSGKSGKKSSGKSGKKSSGKSGEKSSGKSGKKSSGKSGEKSSGKSGKKSSGKSGEHNSNNSETNRDDDGTQPIRNGEINRHRSSNNSGIRHSVKNAVKNIIDNNQSDLDDPRIHLQTRLNKNPIRECTDPNKCLIPFNKNIYQKTSRYPNKCTLVKKIIKKGDVYGAY